MRVVIALPHLTPGGAERTASVLANYLVSKGDEVFILLMYRREIFYEVDSRVTIVQPPAIQAKTGKFLYLFYIIYFLHFQLRRLKPDIVFAIGYMVFTLLSSIGLSGKVILSGRSSPSRVRFPDNLFLNFMYILLHNMLRFRVRGIIAQTNRAEDVYRKKYKSQIIEVIPNFLRAQKEHQTPRENQIVTVGRCEREKGHEYLLKAFSKVKAPAWKLMIVGDGSQRENLEALTRDLGLADRVTITGFQKDVDHYLSQSKIFAFTSLHEGFPNALLEAMATPLACVSFDCDAGPSDLITHGKNGFLVPLKNTEVLTVYLQQLIDDEELRNGMMQNASLARQAYSLPIIGDRYRSFFQKILAA